MAEENTTNNAQPANEEAAQQPSFQLVRCYLKDASLEMPHAPEIFLTAPAEQPMWTFSLRSLSAGFRWKAPGKWLCAARSP